MQTKIRTTLRKPSVSVKGARKILAGTGPKAAVPSMRRPAKVSNNSLKKATANKLGRKRFGPLSKSR